MARPIRIELEDACYHVTARGNERKLIFRSDEDREMFLLTCRQMVSQFGLLVHAYCLMPNHYHMVVSTPRGNLSRAIGWLQTTYTIRFNRKYKRSGHLYQGRFKAHLVEEDEYARVLVPYVHLNPVRGKDKHKRIEARRLKEFESYPWSSHWEYTGKRRTSWVNLDWLTYWGKSKSVAKKRYMEDIRGYFGSESQSPWQHLKGGLLLGSESFVEKHKQRLESKEGQEEVKWADKNRLKSIEVKVEKLISKEIDERIHMWMLTRLAGQPMVDVARRYGYKDGSGVLQVVKRLEASQRKDIRKRIAALEEEVSRIKS